MATTTDLDVWLARCPRITEWVDGSGQAVTLTIDPARLQAELMAVVNKASGAVKGRAVFAAGTKGGLGPVASARVTRRAITE